MIFHFKIPTPLLDRIRADLFRPHAFALERVGFIRAGLARTSDGFLILAGDYRPVDDGHYISSDASPACVGRDGIRTALEWADGWRGGIFHVHTHGGPGIPGFSGIDHDGNARVIPAFFGIAPGKLHGAILLSDERLIGRVWTGMGARPKPLTKVTVVGDSLQSWRLA